MIEALSSLLFVGGYMLIGAILLLVVFLVVFGWERTRAFLFADWNETISWARLQMLAFGAIEAINSLDPSLVQPILGDNYFHWWLLGSGILTEAARRFKADDVPTITGRQREDLD